MATDWSEMTAVFARETTGRDFEPCAHYDADADALTLYFSNEPEHAERLNSRVTIYLSDETGDLVGCRVKGVRAVLEDIGSFDVSLSHRKVDVKMLFAALHGRFSTEPEGRNLYRRIGKFVGQSDLDIDLPDRVNC